MTIIQEAMRAESEQLAQGHEERKAEAALVAGMVLTTPCFIQPVYEYGVWLRLDGVIERIPCAKTADVVISFRGEEKQFTYAEFLKACGFNAHRKARIVTVGTFDEHGMPTGWHFDCGEVSADAVSRLPTGLLVAGYTLDELREIYDRQATST